MRIIFQKFISSSCFRRLDRTVIFRKVKIMLTPIFFVSRTKLLLALLFLLASSFSVITSVSRTELLWRGEGANDKFSRAWLVEAVITASSQDPWSSGEQIVFKTKPKDLEDNAEASETFYVAMRPTRQECSYSLEPYGNANLGSSFLWKIQYFGPQFFRYGLPWEERLVGFRDWIVSNGICEDVDYSKWGKEEQMRRAEWCVNPKHVLTWYSPHDHLALTPGVDVVIVVADPIFYPSSPILMPSGLTSKYFGVEVSVKKESETTYHTATIDVDHPSKWVLENKVYAELLGGLQTKFECPKLEGTYVFVPKGVGTYTPALQSVFNQYIQLCTPSGAFGSLTLWTAMDLALKSFQDTGDVSDVDKLVRQCDAWNSQMMAGTQIGELATRYNIFITTSSASITFDNGFIANPAIRLLIDAYWLGIQLTIPKPQIVNINKPDSFNNRIIATVYVDVKNVGEYAGDVVVDLTCSPPVYYPNGRTRTISISPGETKRVEFGVKYTGTESTTISCTATAYARLDPKVKDSEQFSMEYNYIQYLCEPGTEWCSAEDPTKIFYCTEDGRIEVKADCSELGNYVCTYSAEGKPVCTPREVPPPPTPLEFNIIWILVVFVLSFLIILLLKKRGKELVGALMKKLT